MPKKSHLISQISIVIFFFSLYHTKSRSVYINENLIHTIYFYDIKSASIRLIIYFPMKIGDISFLRFLRISFKTKLANEYYSIDQLHNFSFNSLSTSFRCVPMFASKKSHRRYLKYYHCFGRVGKIREREKRRISKKLAWLIYNKWISWIKREIKKGK